MPQRFERITIAGVGLIGGSFALAVRAAGLAGEIVGYGRTIASLEAARALGLIDRIAADPAEAVRGAELIVLAAPVGALVELAERFRPHARPGALLTDIGSVKGSVVTALEAAWKGIGPVVGSHPIAGSEAWGPAAARADLFRGRLCVLTPTAATDPTALARLRDLWEAVGARVEEMAPAVHDAILARVSHLPHLVAFALVAAAAAARADGHRVLAYAGSGFRDTTRVAASRAEVWRDIALANGPALLDAVAEFRVALDRLEELVRARDGAGLEAAFEAAAAARRVLGGGT
ncbi:MAG: prephenate dehydrogenase/arogenate dehydrogenase family protein [Candidatus Binatia bacterium]